MGRASENTPQHKEKKISIALLAHVDAGKTTLSESLLYTAGKIRSFGRVDKGDAYLDTYELEKKRGITIFSKQAVFSFGGTEITLLDTPGHVDFSAEMERTLQVLDYAVLVISAADGVQAHTQTLWRLLRRYKVPAFLFVNKMDQNGTDISSIMTELKERLSANIVNCMNPETEECKEEIALCDEELLEKYIEEGDFSADTIPSLVAAGKLFPCFSGSALKNEGIGKLLQALDTLTTSKEYKEEFSAREFKIARDEVGNRLTYLKVTGGVLRARMEIEVAEGCREKVNQIRIYSGERYESVPEVGAGTICAVTGLLKTYPAQGLGSETEGIGAALNPVLTYRVELPEGCDAAVFLPKLRELEEEQPELHVVWNEKLQEIQVQVMGEVQIEILQSLILERFGVQVCFGTGNIVYKETISRPVEGVGHFEPLRHYAEVHLWMESGEAGSGIQIRGECSEDLLDRNWQRLIFTHLSEREHKGVLTGSALTDVIITLIAGKAHLKHTEGGDFRQATYRAVRQGLMQTESVLLEPYYEYRLELPESYVGRAMSDMERMAGSFTLEQSAAGVSILTGEAPVSTMRGYPREVAAYTKGQGHLSCSLSGYRPCHNADEVIQRMRYEPESDTENPSSSVFCSHGAGITIPWNEVRSYMHIDTGKGTTSADDGREEERTERSTSHEEEWIDTEEIDGILERAMYANRKSGPVSHKGISARRVRSVSDKPEGLAKPRKKNVPDTKYLLVDGYNIIFAWEELRELAKTDIAAARDKLMDILCNYQGYRKCEVILVFDAYRVQNHKTEVMDYHNIHVVYTKEAETADCYIERFAHENNKKYQITVATSDGMEQIIIRGAGCRLLSAADLQREIGRVQEELEEWIEN